MASTYEYFLKSTNRYLCTQIPRVVQNNKSGTKFETKFTLSHEFDAGAKFLQLYVPDCADETAAVVLSVLREIAAVVHESEQIICSGGWIGTRSVPAAELVFTGRLNVFTPYVYHDNLKLELEGFLKSKGIKHVLHDGASTAERNKLEKPDAFVCHDSRDKDFVRELVKELQGGLLNIWFDEYSLNVGDSLRASIERGLKECRKVVIILSPHFLANQGWTKAEFDSVFTREIMEETNVFLPVWHNVGAKEVYEYCPRLPDRVALDSKLGVKEIAKRLATAIR